MDAILFVWAPLLILVFFVVVWTVKKRYAPKEEEEPFDKTKEPCWAWEEMKGQDRIRHSFYEVIRDVLMAEAEGRPEGEDKTIEIENLYDHMDEICDKFKATWRERERAALDKKKSRVKRKNKRLNELQEKLD